MNSLYLFIRLYLVLLFLFQCSAQPKTAFTASTPFRERQIQIVTKKKEVIYYRFAPSLEEVDPEKVATFKTDSLKPEIINLLNQILQKNEPAYGKEKAKRCLPVFTSAIKNKEEVYFLSFSCAILKVKGENLYLNFDSEKASLETSLNSLN